jgi:tRNA-Thr(GGU) m(6)t(6)A37 methyltransferase TsaA
MPRNQNNEFHLLPIGRIRLGNDQTFIDIEPQYEEGLLNLDTFSHIMVLYWFDRNDHPEARSILRLRPRKDPRNPICGVFATHSPRRPNLIAMTVCRLLSVDGRTITVDAIDAKDNSPVIDIKCYIPEAIEAQDVRLPEWVKNREERQSSAEKT